MVRSRQYLLVLFLIVHPMICVLEAWPQDEAHSQGMDTKIRREEENLQEIRLQIEECRRELGQLHGREATILDSIRTVEKELSLLKKLMVRLDSRRRELGEEINRAKMDHALMEDRLETNRQRLARRLRSMYKRGRSHRPAQPAGRVWRSVRSMSNTLTRSLT